ncbi:hypothetical protein [Oscillatoria acuminata]|nr:hypothetical protein [Oscillatoria acuminata]
MTRNPGDRTQKLTLSPQDNLGPSLIYLSVEVRACNGILGC